MHGRAPLAVTYPYDLTRAEPYECSRHEASIVVAAAREWRLLCERSARRWPPASIEFALDAATRAPIGIIATDEIRRRGARMLAAGARPRSATNASSRSVERTRIGLGRGVGRCALGDRVGAHARGRCAGLGYAFRRGTGLWEARPIRTAG